MKSIHSQHWIDKHYLYRDTGDLICNILPKKTLTSTGGIFFINEQKLKSNSMHISEMYIPVCTCMYNQSVKPWKL